jgi:16S rRNA (adenine1518-N6/adenine1519-N6)-dimethyltransferase
VVEHFIDVEGVTGSNPVLCTIFFMPKFQYKHEEQELKNGSQHKPELKAKKSLGQNFLHDPHFQNKIFEHTQKLFDTTKKENTLCLEVVEIGPGRGDLTKLYQILNPKSFTLYELDSDLMENLSLNFPKANIFCRDFMDVIPSLKECFLVSNLPYYIGSRLIIDLIKYNKNYPFAFILQKEVAYKVKQTDRPTFFGACLNLFYDAKVELVIPPSAFKPAPKVHSALLVAKPKTVTYDGLRAIKILKAMFFKPNKTLLNNLLNSNLGYSKSELEVFLKTANLDPSVRISWPNYEQVYDGLNLVLPSFDILE